MSLGSMAVVARLALRGKLQFRRADGSVCKEVEILDGSLPLVAPVEASHAEPVEPTHVPDHP